LFILSLVTSVVIVFAGVILLRHRAVMREVVHVSSTTMAENLLEQLKKRAELSVSVLSGNLINPLYQYDMATIYNLLETIKEEKDVLYVYVYDTAGHIIHDGTKQIQSLDKVLDDEVSKRAVAAKELLIQTAEDSLDVAMPIRLHHELLGGVRAGFSLKGIRSDIEEMRNQLGDIGRTGIQQSIHAVVVVNVGLLAAAMILAFFVARGLTRPIVKLVKGTEAIARGEFDQKIDVRTKDELGTLLDSQKFSGGCQPLKAGIPL